MRRIHPRQVTLKDLAAATGVSINTVSRALRGKDDIAEQTREKIMRAADEMGYVNNMIASSLRLGYTNTIAVVLSDISNPYFAIVTKKIEVHARDLGYSSFLINTSEDDEIEKQAIRSALNKNVDGLILCPSQKKADNVQYLKEIGLPFILWGRRFKNVETDFVTCDDVKGGYMATQKLIEAGHKKIMMLNGPLYISTAEDRLAGYKKALEEAGIEIDEKLIHHVLPGGSEIESLASKLVHGEIKCTAIFAFSDILALAMWAALENLGAKVPQDYSLIGYDNIRHHLAMPGQLCSIGLFSDSMALSAMNVLSTKMRDKDHELTQILIEPQFVPGATIKPLAS